MSIPSYLLLIFLTAQVAHAYTVVLRSGKRIEGTLISDQQTTIVIRDSKGVLISFRKNLLDLDAMSGANPQRKTIEPAPPRRQASLTLAQVAAESKKRRTGKAKELNLEDMNPAIPFSVMGSERAAPARSLSVKAGPSEREWQSRLWTLKKEVNRLKEKAIAAGSSCDQSKEKQQSMRTTPSNKPVELRSTFRETSQCRKSSEIASQLQEAEMRLDLAREEARRAGVSWQTLE